MEDLRQFESGARPLRSGAQQRPITVGYVAVAIAIFAAAMLIVGGVHRHRTKATAGALMDGDQRIALTQNNLSGDGQLPAEYRTLVAETIRTGSLLGTVPAHAADVSFKNTPHPSDAAFRLLTPVNATSVSDQPLLDWEDLDDAEQYRVNVYDASGHIVAESPMLAASAWRPAEPLDRGQTYHWVVSARLGDKDVRVPADGAPAATFRVASQDVADQLLLAQAQYPEHHLLLATMFARAGDTQAASRELDLADEQDGGHPLLAKLRASLRQRPSMTNAQ